jgi:uncharacterized protein YkwD
MHQMIAGLIALGMLTGCSVQSIAQVALDTAVQVATQKAASAAVDAAIDAVKKGASPAPTAAPTATPGPPTTAQLPTGEFAAEITAAHGQANKERAAQNLPPLTLVPAISEVARQYAVYMATHDHFDHSDLDGHGPDFRLTQGGVAWSAMGENILYNYDGTGLKAIDQWMHSPGHRANILSSSFGKVGYGVYKDGSGKYWWCQDFTN